MAEGGQDSAFEFMKTLLETGIDDCWPNFTNLIADIKTKDGEVIWWKKYKSRNSHAEIQMLNDVEFKDEIGKVKDDKTKKVDIILTLNYSPCSECADKLKKFYEDNKSLIQKFTIRFSRLYRINVQENKDGLKDLDRAGITLEAMTPESWFDVLMTDKSWLESMSTDQKSSFETIMKKKDKFDRVMKLFGLNHDRVKKRDADTSEGLKKLIMEEVVEKTKSL